MNFIFVSLQRINTDRESTSTSLAKELSKSHRVLYVNPPIDRRTLYSGNHDRYTEDHIKLIKDKSEGLVRVTETLSVLNPGRIIESVNWIPITPVFSLFNLLNNRTFASCIQKAIRELGFDSFILINDKDMFRSFYLKELLKPSLSVYLDRDYTLGFDYWRRHGTKLEPLLMEKSDLVVCNSLDFTRRALKYNPQSYYIGNGADLAVFNPDKVWNMPDELKMIKRPVIGYVGALNSMRVDISLIAAMADARKDWHFVFIGSEDAAFKDSVLHSIDNITFIAKKHTKEVPAYVKHFDVCINPQLVNEITIGNFPLKIVEYLSMGRPVVATETNTMREVFSEITFLAKDVTEFIRGIENALGDNHPEAQSARSSFAQQYSWKSVAGLLLGHIHDAAMRKQVTI